jgi:hypothetical protein
MTTTDVIKEVLLNPVTKAERPTKTASQKKVSGQKVAAYAESISQAWQKSTDCILRVAAHCAAAKNELSRSEKQELIERLPFGEVMFSKLANIGDDSRLNKHQELLPPSISTLYLIQNLSDEQLEAAVTEQILRPDVTRSEVEEWKLGKTDTPPARNKSNDLERPFALYCVYSETPLHEEKHRQMQNVVVSIAEDEGLKVAIFTGEKLVAQLKAFFSKQARAV